MSDWQQLAIILAVGAIIGLGLRIFFHRRQSTHVERLRRVNRQLSWQYYAAGAIMFAVLAWGNRDRFPFLLICSVFGIMQIYAMVRSFVQQRTQYGLRHLFIAVTVAAVVSGFCRLWGAPVVVVLGMLAGATVLILFGLEWQRQKLDNPDGLGGSD